MALSNAIVIEEDVGRLRVDAESDPDVTVGVGDVLESAEPVVVYELLHCLAVILTGDTDEPNVVPVGCLRFCDRRSHCLTVRSPRRPEPEDHVVTDELCEVDLAAIERLLENRTRRCSDRAGGSSVGGSRRRLFDSSAARGCDK